jgi:hypothetical protein
MKRSNVAWMRGVLLAAVLHNVLWGAFVVLSSFALFRSLGMELPNYPEIWQHVGMIVGVYGVGYAVAASTPCATGPWCWWACSARSSVRSASSPPWRQGISPSASASPC